MDPVLTTRRTEITSQIAAVNSRAKQVDKMGQTIQSQIDEIYKRGCDQVLPQLMLAPCYCETKDGYITWRSTRTQTSDLGTR